MTANYAEYGTPSTDGDPKTLRVLISEGHCPRCQGRLTNTGQVMYLDRDYGVAVTAERGDRAAGGTCLACERQWWVTKLAFATCLPTGI